MSTNIRFPSGEIQVYKHHISVVRGLISAHQKIHPENILFFNNGNILTDLIAQYEITLDVAFKVQDKYIISNKALEEVVVQLGFEPLIPSDSIIENRNNTVYNWDIRFFEESDIFYKKYNLRSEFEEKAKPFYQGFEAFKKSRISEISILLEKIQSQTVVISCFNHPYIELLENFVASCDINEIDIRKTFIAFPMDLESAKACRRLNIYYVFIEGSYGPVTSNHGNYGDGDFAICMFMKNAIVQDLLSLGRDVLFMDIDMVWKKNPIDRLNALSNIRNTDFLFMYDGLNLRFQPLYYNSGFFFCANNQYTKKTWEVLFNNYASVLYYRSQQFPLNIIMNTMKERGLRTMRLDEVEFLNGHRLNDNKRNIGNIPDETYVVHASWTSNKKDKIKNLKAMKLWYLN